jgi:hypothetical protein
VTTEFYGRTIGDLIAKLDVLLSVDNDLLFTADSNDLRSTVRVA